MFLLIAGLFYIQDAVIEMREQPTDDSRVASYAIFSEKISVEDRSGEWSYITTPDGYSGWAETDGFIERDKPYETTLKVSRLAAHLYSVKDTEFGPIQTLPYGSRLQAVNTEHPRWIEVILPDDHQCYIQKGDVAAEPKLTHKKELVAFSQKFLGLPYTWGGRSSFGYDCSGFVQMLYSQIGIDLQRDAKQQIVDQRFRTISIDELESGDLIFFGQSAQQIRHVGMAIGNGQFIHSGVAENQPWIRVSNLSDLEWSGRPDIRFSYRLARQLKDK